jgi:hypothetical protein
LIASKATSALNSLVNFLRSRFIWMCNFGFNLAFFKSSFSRPHQLLPWRTLEWKEIQYLATFCLHHRF